MAGPTDLAATVREHDVATGSGSVLLDDGRRIPYDDTAFRAGGLRLLRSGQRVRIRVDGDLTSGAATITAITLATFDLP